MRARPMPRAWRQIPNGLEERPAASDPTTASGCCERAEQLPQMTTDGEFAVWSWPTSGGRPRHITVTRAGSHLPPPGPDRPYDVPAAVKWADQDQDQDQDPDPGPELAHPIGAIKIFTHFQPDEERNGASAGVPGPHPGERLAIPCRRQF